MKEALPPYDDDAETSVLGSLLIDGEAIGTVDIEVSDFFSEQNQHVFAAMLATKGQVDQITVAHELQRMGKLDDAGGAAYLFHLTANTPTSLHLNYYADIVKKCSFNRRLISAAGQIETLGYRNLLVPDAVDELTKVSKRLISSTQDESVLTPDKVAVNAFEFYTNANKQQSISTGLQPFDEVKSGYLVGEYVMLAGRTGKGKTTLALQQACHIAETKQVLFFSMEMFQQQVTNKNIARITGLPEMAIALKGVYTEKTDSGQFIRHNGFTDPQWKSILAAIDRLSKLNLFIAEGNRSLDSIRRLVEKQLNSTGCDMVFIDYLGLIRERQGKDGHDRYNFLSEELSRMPKEYRIPWVVLHQMNRESEYRTGDNRDPKITDLREGGEESVDLLMMLARSENPNLSEIHVLKDRLRGDPCIVPVNWNNGRYS
jgi:replicative DNA helicase